MCQKISNSPRIKNSRNQHLTRNPALSRFPNWKLLSQRSQKNADKGLMRTADGQANGNNRNAGEPDLLQTGWQGRCLPGAQQPCRQPRAGAAPVRLRGPVGQAACAPVRGAEIDGARGRPVRRAGGRARRCQGRVREHCTGCVQQGPQSLLSADVRTRAPCVKNHRHARDSSVGNARVPTIPAGEPHVSTGLHRES